MKNLKIILLSFILLASSGIRASNLEIYSPDKRIKVEVFLREKVYYSVLFDNERIVDPSPISMKVDSYLLGEKPDLKKSNMVTVDQQIKTVYGSRKEIRDNYNELTLDLTGDYSIQFRAYDNGAAYRFVTRLKEKTVKVYDEEVAFRFKFGISAWLYDDASYETNFKKESFDFFSETKLTDRKIFLPAIVQASPKVKILITEAGLYDYPSLFLHRGDDFEEYLLGQFEKYALTTKTGGFSNYSEVVDKEADYIAATEGTREYPWRLMMISDKDATFADCDLVYQLSKPCALKETDWIKPGKVSWEWWDDYVVEGQDFKGGVNTDTYLYHIDFAAKYHLEYILIDWLWTDKYDLTLFNPDVDLKRIIDYGKGKSVRVLLWCPGHTLYSQLDQALDLFASYGAAGVKADFFGREDQTGIKMYEDIAKATAARKMLIDFHGSAKPTGLSRTYPNVINYEAVAGNEWNKLSIDKCTSKHKVMLPFTRGAVGPMDFTPGGMRNVLTKHVCRFTLPEVHGTRANEMALFVLYNEPLKMLCDAPSVYEREPEVTGFIAKIPTVWDDTKVLEAKFGEYIVTARKTGNTWYVAGITDETSREINIDLSFLGEGTFTAEIIRDGANSAHVGIDYKMEKKQIRKDSKLVIPMAGAGGFVLSINK